MLRDKGVSDQQLRERHDRAKAINDEALAFAIEAPTPPAETVGDYVYA